MADRMQLLAQAEELLRKPNYSREDSKKVEDLIALADSLVDHDAIRRAKMNQYADELGVPRLPVPRTPDARFMAYMRQGKGALTQEERLRIHPVNEGNTLIRAAQSVGTSSAGGYLVPTSFADWFFSVLKATDAIFELSTVWETRTGSTSGFPILDDTSNEATIISENSTSSEADAVFAALAFGETPMWRSGYLRCSIELVNDSHFDLEKLIAAAAAVRFARGIGGAFITTLLAAAGNGGTTASATAIAASEVVTLTEKVDSAYLGDASFLMQRSTYIALLQLIGSSGNFMFPAAFDAAGRPLLLGFPVYFSPSMGAMTASQQPITFGSHSHFLQRRVANSLSIKVLVELFALYAQVGYECHWRVDGGLLLSGSNIPVAVLTMHS